MDFLDHLRADSQRFVQVLSRCDPAARVPSCPDWTAADLLWHLGEVQLFWATVVAERLTDPDPAESAKPERPENYGALLAFFESSSAALVHTLAQTPHDTTVWTWFDSDQSAGFVRRRQAHEALIHRLDAELTAGDLTEVDADLATDGVKEVLDWMYSEPPEWGTIAPAGAIGTVATTDTGAGWFVQLGSWSGTSPNTGNVYTDEGSITVVEGGDATFSVTGTARDLDAWLWNRPPIGEITRAGEYAQFEAIIRSGVQ